MYRVWREVLAASESWYPSGLQLPRVLELDLHSDGCSMPATRHWLALRHLNESLPGATAWRIHSFKPSHPTAAKGLGMCWTMTLVTLIQTWGVERL